jgi:hypothetical protein
MAPLKSRNITISGTSQLNYVRLTTFCVDTPYQISSISSKGFWEMEYANRHTGGVPCHAFRTQNV